MVLGVIKLNEHSVFEKQFDARTQKVFTPREIRLSGIRMSVRSYGLTAP